MSFIFYCYLSLYLIFKIINHFLNLNYVLRQYMDKFKCNTIDIINLYRFCNELFYFKIIEDYKKNGFL